jgi:hypothetical protein
VKLPSICSRAATRSKNALRFSTGKSARDILSTRVAPFLVAPILFPPSVLSFEHHIGALQKHLWNCDAYGPRSFKLWRLIEIKASHQQETHH